MLSIFALAVGVIFACGVYLVLRRDWVAVAFGFGLIGTAVNILLLVAARVEHMRPPLVEPDTAVANVGNPLPQAFVLTAIVIGFAVVTVVLALASRRRDDGDPRPPRSATASSNSG